MPQTPRYAKPAPLPNKKCLSCGGDKGFVYPPLVSGGGGGGLVTEVLPGDDISVDNLSDSDTYRFRVNYNPDVALTSTLDLILKSAGVVKAQPVLQGVVIDEIKSDWTYNKSIASQALTFTVQSPDVAIPAPSLNAGERTKTVSSVSVTKDASVKIHGDDGNGSISETTKPISFGNYVAFGHGADKIGAAASTVQALYDALSKEVKTNRVKTLSTTGGPNEYFFYLVPKRFGDVTFTKGIFQGGYFKLNNVAGVLKKVLDPGDVVLDIVLSNGAGFSEAYDVWQSLYDNKNDEVTPTYAS